MNDPKVTICIPTYERAEYLRGCIRSILAQTYRDLELIVLDNASTDGTPAVVAEFADPRIRSIRNERNIGPFGNMNLGISLARGEYICIAHDDDAYLPRFVERLATLLDEHPKVGIVHCAVYEIEPDGSRRRILRAYPTTRVLRGREEFLRFLRGHNVCCSSVMVRRPLYEEIGGFDARYLCADFKCWLRLALRGDVGYVAEPLVEVRVHNQRATARLEPDRWYREFMAILEEGLVLGAATDPSLVADRDAILRAASLEQGQRFFIAALAATRHGDDARAREYIAILERFQALGLSPLRSTVARLLANPVGRVLLTGAAGVRAARARRALRNA